MITRGIRQAWLLGLLSCVGGCYLSHEAPTSEPAHFCERGHAPTVLATADIGHATGFAVDERSIYFADREGVLAVPKWGGDPRRIARAEGIHRLEIDAASVYFNTDEIDGIPRVSKDGGSRDTLAADKRFWQILVDDDTLYGVTREALWEIDPETSDASRLAAFDLPVPVLPAARAGTLFFATRANTGPSPIAKVSKSGGELEQLASTSILRGFAVDDTHAYWSSERKERIARTPIAGGGVEVVAETTYPYAVATDDDYVYWAAHELEGSRYSGRLVARPRTGGPTVTLASWERGLVTQLHLEDERIFFAAPGDEDVPGQVLCVGKPAE